MAEEKKKRGRPPKPKDSIINEKQSNVRMSNDISIADVRNRLQSMFTTMHNENIPYSRFSDAISRNPLDINPFLSNPFTQNARLKRSNSSINLLSKEQIGEALRDPGNNERDIRASSMALFYSNYVYQNLIRLNRDVPQFFYYVTPYNVQKKDLKQDKFLKEKYFVDEFLKEFNIPFTFKNISLQVSREGKCSYVFRSSYDLKKGIVDFALLQKLPSDYVKYTGFGSDSPLITSFDFSFFLDPTNDVSQWPEWFGEIWKQLIECGIVNIDKRNGKYKIKPSSQRINLKQDFSFECINGTYFLYVEMPQDLVYTFGSDFGDPFAIPEYAGLFQDLSELDAYKKLQQQTLLTNITNVLTAEVPVEKDAQGGSDAAILSPEVIMGLEGDCSAALNSNIFPFFAPLENFKMHTIDHVPSATDIVLNSVRNVMSTAGVSGLINTNDKPSVAMIKGEQMLIESKMEYYSIQYMKFLNMILKKYLGLSYKFTVTLWGGVYNWRDEVKTLKEMVISGYKGLLPRLMSAYRMTIDDYCTQHEYVDTFDILNDIEEQQTVSKGNVGRPAKSDTDIDNDNTAASKENGGNVSDVK